MLPNQIAQVCGSNPNTPSETMEGALSVIGLADTQQGILWNEFPPRKPASSQFLCLSLCYLTDLAVCTYHMTGVQKWLQGSKRFMQLIQMRSPSQLGFISLSSSEAAWWRSSQIIKGPVSAQTIKATSECLIYFCLPANPENSWDYIVNSGFPNAACPDIIVNLKRTASTKHFQNLYFKWTLQLKNNNTLLS